MVFGVKIGDSTWKARFCANGSKTDPPKDSTFSTVVSKVYGSYCSSYSQR
jgi:hypothetical protein